jgi:hypothetical protein
LNCKKSAVTDAKKKQEPITVPAAVRKRLEARLLSLGGSRVIWEAPDPEAALIADQGQPFSQRVRMRRGEPSRCHANAAELWAGAADRYQLVTGYALSGDRWVSHSWVIDGDTLYETTHRFDRYFGVVLPPLGALKFWMENVFVHDYPGGDAPPEYWESRPGVLALVREIVRRPRGESNRLDGACLPGDSAPQSPRKEKA